MNSKVFIISPDFNPISVDIACFQMTMNQPYYVKLSIINEDLPQLNLFEEVLIQYAIDSPYRFPAVIKQITQTQKQSNYVLECPWFSRELSSQVLNGDLQCIVRAKLPKSIILAWHTQAITLTHWIQYQESDASLWQRLVDHFQLNYRISCQTPLTLEVFESTPILELTPAPLTPTTHGVAMKTKPQHAPLGQRYRLYDQILTLYQLEHHLGDQAHSVLTFAKPPRNKYPPTPSTLTARVIDPNPAAIKIAVDLDGSEVEAKRLSPYASPETCLSAPLNKDEPVLCAIIDNEFVILGHFCKNKSEEIIELNQLHFNPTKESIQFNALQSHLQLNNHGQINIEISSSQCFSHCTHWQLRGEQLTFHCQSSSYRQSRFADYTIETMRLNAQTIIFDCKTIDYHGETWKINSEQLEWKTNQLNTQAQKLKLHGNKITMSGDRCRFDSMELIFQCGEYAITLSKDIKIKAKQVHFHGQLNMSSRHVLQSTS